MLVLVAFVVVGALAGLVWERVWTPPTGIVVSHRFVLDGAGVGHAFSGTGLYVMIAAAAGCLTGLAVGLATRSRPVATLLITVVGAVIGGWVMARVGHRLGPSDPDQLAKTLVDLSPLHSDLRVSGRSPYLAMPAGAVLGQLLSYLVWWWVEHRRTTAGSLTIPPPPEAAGH